MATTAQVTHGLRDARDSRLVVSADEADAALAGEGATDAKLLRYDFSRGDRFRVTTRRIVTIQGNVGETPVEVTRELEEHLALKVTAVDDSGRAILEVQPERLLGSVVTRIDGRERNRNSLDTRNSAKSSDAWLQQFDGSAREFLSSRFRYSVTARGAVLLESPDEREADYRLFRTVRCGFVAPLFPLFPEAAIKSGQSWQVAEELGDNRRVRIRWTPAKSDDKFMLVNGIGSVSRPRTAVRGAQSIPLTAELRLHQWSRLPLLLTLQQSGQRVPDTDTLRNPVQSVSETRQWVRIPAILPGVGQAVASPAEVVSNAAVKSAE